MNILTIIRLVGILCWLWHSRSHTKVADAFDVESGRWAEHWMCRECGKTWETTR